MGYVVWICVAILETFALLYLIYNLRLQWAASRLTAREDVIAPASWPTVTVQVVLYNEGRTPERLLNALTALDYPRELLDVQILDNSDDRSVAINQSWVTGANATGLYVHYIKRNNVDGYKAGALRDGLARACGELICIFDADFCPPPDYLRRTVWRFSNPNLALVQSSWDARNGKASFAAKMAHFWLLQHATVEQPGRHNLSEYFSFNGSAGVWRKQSIIEGGGWSSDSVTEDLDLSLRVWLTRKYKFYFDTDTVVSSEVPESMQALKTQLASWAKGNAQVLAKHWRVIICAPWPENFTLLLHSSAYMFVFLLLALALLFGPLAVLGNSFPTAHLWLCEIPGRAVMALGAGQILLAAFTRDRMVGFRPIYYQVLGVGLAPWIARHFWQGLWHLGGKLPRTPRAIENTSRLPDHYCAGIWTEVVLGVLCLASASFCLSRGYWGSSFLPLAVSIGLFSIAIRSNSGNGRGM